MVLYFGNPQIRVQALFGQETHFGNGIVFGWLFYKHPGQYCFARQSDCIKNITSSLVAALGYEFRLTKYMRFYTMAGRSIEQEGKLRNDDRGDVFLLNDEANFYIRTGFKIGIF